MDELWHRAAQISASGEPAVLVTVMAVQRQVPQVSPPGTCMIATPGVAAIVRASDPVEALLGLDLTPATFVVLMSVGHRLDMPAVQRLRGQPLRYLGMMGSRRRVATCVETLAAAGFMRDDLSRIQAPIGLNLGAESPYEIAVAILAQLIQVQHSQISSVSDWTLPTAQSVG